MFVQSSALAHLSVTVGKTKFTYGAFLNDVINFVITAFVIFVLIKFINKLFPKKEEIVEEQKNEELETLQEIRDLLKK